MTCHAACTFVVVVLSLTTLALLPPSTETLVALVGVALALARAIAVGVWRRSLDASYGVTLSCVVVATLFVDAGTRSPTLYAMLLAAAVATSALYVRYCEGPELLWRHWTTTRSSLGGDPPAAHSHLAVIIDD